MHDDHPHRGPVRNASAGLVVLAMVVAALSMWTVVPFVWLWIASQLSESQAPAMGPYMVVLLGIVASIVLLGWLLGQLNGLYGRITGNHAIASIHPSWLKSMRDEPEHHGASVMEAVIVTSVILALVAMGLWFFIFAGSPIPSQ